MVVVLAILFLAGWLASADTHHFKALHRGEAGERPGASTEAQSLEDKVLRLHFLDVGQGDCILIECPEDNEGKAKFIMVYGGSNTFYMENRQPERFVKGAAAARDQVDSVLGDCKQVYTLVVTHPHTDHYDLLP
jgi:beta-lactamase superfamily II metal-dependent hydrolase